jgi:hypothetical protein
LHSKAGGLVYRSPISLIEEFSCAASNRTVPPEKAGLKANDVILQFARQDVVGAMQLTRLVSETPVGRTVDVTVRRDNREQTLKVTTEKAPFTIGGIRMQHPELSEPGERIQHSIPRIDVITSAQTQQGHSCGLPDAQLRDFFGVKTSNGVLVASVDAASPAERGGVQAGGRDHCGGWHEHRQPIGLSTRHDCSQRNRFIEGNPRQAGT